MHQLSRAVTNSLAQHILLQTRTRNAVAEPQTSSDNKERSRLTNQTEEEQDKVLTDIQHAAKLLKNKPAAALAKIDEVHPPKPPMLFSESSIQSMPANIEERQYRKKNIRKRSKHVCAE